jgi:hypothetical protein
VQVWGASATRARWLPGKPLHATCLQTAAGATCILSRNNLGTTMSTTPPNSPPKSLMMAMEPPPRPSSALFDVYLRLRPSNSANTRFLTVEERDDSHPTHITVRPLVNDNRKRAVERFAFTQVFEEDARQMDIFQGTGIVPMIEGVLGAPGCHGRDSLLATLGVTGSGKVHGDGFDESRSNADALPESHYTREQVAARSCSDDT